MSEDQIFPVDYYLSFPYLRLSERRYIILDNQSLFHVKIKKDKSYVTLIHHIPDILKMEVLMVRMKYSSYLSANFMPKEGKKKSYVVAPQSTFYKLEDWRRVANFFRLTGFKPHIFPDTNKINSKFIPISPDETVWFDPNDIIFQLYDDPAFMENYYYKLRIWPILLSIFGCSFFITGLIFAFVAFDLFLSIFLILGGSGGLLMLLGLPGTIRTFKQRKDFLRKYNLERHFK